MTLLTSTFSVNSLSLWSVRKAKRWKALFSARPFTTTSWASQLATRWTKGSTCVCCDFRWCVFSCGVRVVAAVPLGCVLACCGPRGCCWRPLGCVGLASSQRRSPL